MSSPGSFTKNPLLRRHTHRLVCAVTAAATVVGVTGAASATPGIPGEVRGEARRSVATDLTVSSFNVLGSSHTRHHARYASGVRRTDGVARLVEKHDVEVVGFQEMQSDQLRTFLDRTEQRYDVHPGFTLRDIDTENSIAWDRTEWEALKRRTVDVPYFDGNRRAMPVVKLRNLRTGMTAWFVNVHNPATNAKHPGQDGWRRKAIRIEVNLVRRLSKSGLPVFLTGDMNEREQAFCPVTGGAPMQAARGGSHRDGVCRAENPRFVDWVFGHRKVGFHHYRELTGGLVARTSDHPMILTEARLHPTRYPDAFTPPADRSGPVR
jgi:hypothetical protein